MKLVVYGLYLAIAFGWYGLLAWVDDWSRADALLAALLAQVAMLSAEVGFLAARK